jgi:Tol biopolymer transport system component
VGTLALLLAAALAMAAAPEGPRLAVLKVAKDWTRVELISVNRSGAQPLRLAGGGPSARPIPYPSSPISWRPDGSQVAFSAFTINGRGRERLWIFLAKADGSGLRMVPKSAEAYGPVFSPNGRTIAFTRVLPDERLGFRRAAIWTLDLPTGEARRLTPWRDGLHYYASSFSPDGSTLLATRYDDQLGGAAELLALNLDGDGPARLPVEGYFAVYSPDGSQIALLREPDSPTEGADLYVLDVASGTLRRLTHTRSRERFASWDPSGERIAYGRSPHPGVHAPPPNYYEIMQINADGTCQTKVFSAPRAAFAFSAPAWQPGPGRGAGRIAC